MKTRRKVSVTVEENLLEEVDRVAGKLTRSAVFQQALVSWLRRRRQAELDRAIEEYYLSQSLLERSEDAEWAGLGDDTVREGWAGSEK